MDETLPRPRPPAPASAPGPERERPRRAALLLLPPLVFLGLVFLYPVAVLIAQSFTGKGPLLGNYARLVTQPVYLQVFERTLWLSLLTTAICLALGYPVAYRLSTASRRGKAILLVFILLPFWTNLLVRTYGWMILLNPKGVVNQALLGLGLVRAPLALVYNAIGVLTGMVQIMLPYMVLPIAAVMARIDPRLRNAARSLGAGPLPSFLLVYFPMTLPGVMAGVLLVFTVSLGFFVVPAVLGGPRDLVLAQLIEFNVNTSLDWGFAGALSTVLLVLTLGFYGAAQRWFGLGALWGSTR